MYNNDGTGCLKGVQKSESYSIVSSFELNKLYDRGVARLPRDSQIRDITTKAFCKNIKKCHPSVAKGLFSTFH